MPSDHIARTREAREITRESRLRAAIDAANIGETNRRILRMRYIDGRCFAYIAAELGFSESQIYRRHKAAMVILSAILREDGRDAMRRRIHEMMDGASEKDREALRRCLDAMG